MSSPYKLFGKRKSKSLQQECANLAGGPGSDPKAAAARAQGREPGEMNESSAFNPNNKAKQGSSGMFYRGPKPVAGVNRNPVKKLGMFKADPPGSKKTKVFGGRGTVDTSTKKGRDILKEINSIPTVSSTEPGRVTKGKITVKHNPKAKYGQTPPSGNKVKRTVYKPSGSQYGTWTKIGKGIAKVGGKALMGGIIDPTNKKDPRIVKQIQKANTKKIDYKKTY